MNRTTTTRPLCTSLMCCVLFAATAALSEVVDKPQFRLLPQPRDFEKIEQGGFPLELPLAVVVKEQHRSLPEFQALIGLLTKMCGRSPAVVPPEVAAGRAIVLTGRLPEQPAEFAQGKAAWQFSAEAYSIHVDKARISLVCGPSPNAFRYGVRTLHSLIEQTARKDPPVVAPVKVADAPAFAFRGFLFYINHPHFDIDKTVFDPARARAVLKKMAEARLNVWVFEVAHGMVYDSHPELAIPGSLPKEEIRELAGYARELGLEVIPQINLSAGHIGWLRPYDVVLDQRLYWQAVEEIIEEQLALFNPRYIHLGMDEDFVRRKGAYLEALNHLAGFCRSRGVTPMIWGDHFNRHHGDRYFYDLARVPRDVIIVDWHYGYHYKEPPKKYPSVDVFLKAGFRVVPCTRHIAWNIREYSSYAASRSNPNLLGMLGSTWHSLDRGTYDSIVPLSGQAYWRPPGSYPQCNQAVSFGVALPRAIPLKRAPTATELLKTAEERNQNRWESIRESLVATAGDGEVIKNLTAAVETAEGLARERLCGVIVRMVRVADRQDVAGAFGQNLERFCTWLNGNDASLADLGAEVLSRACSDAGIDVLAGALEGESAGCAARALKYAHAPRVAPSLSTLLFNEASSLRARAAAARALGNYKDEETLNALQRAALSPAREVRLASAEALRRMRHRRSAGVLAELANDEDNEVAFAALTALVAVGGAKAQEVIRENLRKPQPLSLVAMSMASRVGLGDDAIVEVLQENAYANTTVRNLFLKRLAEKRYRPATAVAARILAAHPNEHSYMPEWVARMGGWNDEIEKDVLRAFSRARTGQRLNILIHFGSKLGGKIPDDLAEQILSEEGPPGNYLSAAKVRLLGTLGPEQVALAKAHVDDADARVRDAAREAMGRLTKGWLIHRKNVVLEGYPAQGWHLSFAKGTGRFEIQVEALEEKWNNPKILLKGKNDFREWVSFGKPRVGQDGKLIYMEAFTIPKGLTELNLIWYIPHGVKAEAEEIIIRRVD